MSLIPKKSKLVKNAEELSGNKRDMRKKLVKSNTKQSDLKRPITKRAQGGLASFIEVEDHPTTITPTEFSEYSFPLSNTYIDIKQKDQPIKFEEENTISSKYVPLSNESPQLGNNSFDKILNEVSSNNPSVKNLRKFLTETARAESNFDFNVQNKAGAPAYGAFQFMDFNIKPLGVSVEQFRNNPKLQIEAAANLANQFKSQFTEEDKRLAKEKGYNENALLAGAWLGGVKGVRKVLRGQGNPSDKHWSKEGKGTTVKDRMDKFNKMKEGGVLKYEDGNKVDPAILEYWKKQNVVLPSPKNEQLSVDNRTKELKEAQQRDIKTKQLGNNLKQLGTDTRNQLGTILSFTNPSFGLALGLGDAAIAATNGNYIEGGIQAGLEVLPFAGKAASIANKALKNTVNTQVHKVGMKYPTLMHRPIKYPEGRLMGKGSRQMVYNGGDYMNKVVNIGDKNAENFFSKKQVMDYVKETLKKNDVPGFEKVSYKGFVKQGSEFKPVFGQKGVYGIDNNNSIANNEKVHSVLKPYMESKGWTAHSINQDGTINYINQNGEIVGDLRSANVSINKDNPTIIDLDFIN